MTAHNKQGIDRTIKKLVLTVFAMFGFGFALVPLYDVFCEVTGLNGKTSNEAATALTEGVDETRTITVQFISRTAQGAPWTFRPVEREITVYPGEQKFVKFYARNDSQIDRIAQAIPSVSPGQAAVYFQKIECFCFNHQPLKAQEDVEMALQFYVDPELPDDVRTLTLSYTLYDITDKVES